MSVIDDDSLAAARSNDRYSAVESPRHHEHHRYTAQHRAGDVRTPYTHAVEHGPRSGRAEHACYRICGLLIAERLAAAISRGVLGDKRCHRRRGATLADR